MAKELETALQEQIARKKKAKEEEKKNRILEELKDEERWLKEREEFERNNNNPAAAGPKKQAPATLETAEPPAADSEIPSSPPSQPTPQPKPAPEKQFTHKLDLQLRKLQTEMQAKEKEFHTELEKLKLISNEGYNAQEAADKQLAELKDHIIKRQSDSAMAFGYQNVTRLAPTLGFKPEVRYHWSKSSEKAYGMGKYSRLYFTDYNKTLAVSSRSPANTKDDLLGKKWHPKPKLAGDGFLAGESQMVPWHPVEDSPQGRIKARTMQDFVPKTSKDSMASSVVNKPLLAKGRGNTKSTCEKLDDLMKEFLSHKKREDSAAAKNTEVF